MKKIILAIITLTIIGTSCSKQQELSISPIAKTKVKKTRTISGGIQNFQTLDELNVKIAELKAMNEIELDNYNLNQSSFISLYRQYQIMDANAEAEVSESASQAQENRTIPNIQDDYFASLVNKDGLIICENVVYKYSADHFQTTDLIACDQIEDIDWTNEPQVVFNKTYNYGTKTYASFSPNSIIYNQHNGGSNWAKSNNRNVRAVHTVWCTYYGIYSSIGSKVKMEKNSLILGWININHNSATNNITSPIRKLLLQSGAGFNSNGQPAPGGGWNWAYDNISDSKSTTNQNVNQIVKAESYVIGQIIQHEVGAFNSSVTITRNGQTKTSTWIN